MSFFLRVFVLFVIVFGGLAVGIERMMAPHFVQKDDSVQMPSSLSMAIPSFMVQPRTTQSGLILSGLVAQNRRDWEQAQKQLEILNEEFMPSPLMQLRLMTLALGDGNYDKAIEVAHHLRNEVLSDEELMADLRNVEAYDLARLVLIAEAIKKGEYETAENITDNFHVGALSSFSTPIIKSWIRAVDPKGVFIADTTGLSSLQAIHEALAAEYAGQTDVAISIFDRISRQQITPQTAELIAAFYMRNDEKAKAIDILRRTLLAFPEDDAVRSTLNILKNDEAYEPPYFASLHMKGPVTGLATAFHDFAQIMVMERAIDSALLFARIAVYMDPELPSAYYTIGNILVVQEQWNKAIKAFEKVRADDLDYVDAQVKIAEILIELDQQDKAVSVLEKLIDSEHPQQAEAYFAVGNLYKDREDYIKALEAFDKAEVIGKEANNGELPDWLWPLYYTRAIALDRLDRWDEAEKDLQKALEVRPDNPIVLNYLGYSYAERGINLEEADEMISRAVERAPEDAFIIDSMGWVLYQQDDIDGAIEYLERASMLKPYNAVINDHLGDAYWRAGRRLEAHYMWQRAVDYADLDDTEDQEAVARAKEKLKSGLVASNENQ